MIERKVLHLVYPLPNSVLLTKTSITVVMLERSLMNWTRRFGNYQTSTSFNRHQGLENAVHNRFWTDHHQSQYYMLRCNNQHRERESRCSGMALRYYSLPGVGYN
ncbi:Uncharacterized protein HZ326_4843 [Fusarium oxysporum f. sp. albedinis]|nr:Uncharacterized protein HZ326_4843 [Fusarium oxysporum f. sp. albedinis]